MPSTPFQRLWECVESATLELAEAGEADIFWRVVETTQAAAAHAAMRHSLEAIAHEEWGRKSEVQAALILGISRNTLRSKLGKPRRGGG